MKYCGGTFSGTKSFLCVREFVVVGHRCTPEGRLPDEDRVAKIVAWGPCQSLSEVRAFLGTVGVARIFIPNFAKRAHALVSLTRKDAPFVFGPEQVTAQEDLKEALLSSPALKGINYHSPAPVIVAVDTSPIAVGFYLAQCDPQNVKRHCFARFGSITLNDRECRFSQPKLELYGLYRALRALKVYIVGVRNLRVEVDCRSIKGMLTHPDLAPSASMNRWIIGIQMFHFELVHVPGIQHGPDGLSRRPLQPDDMPEPPEDDFEDWIDRVYGFVHHINPHPAAYTQRETLSVFTQTENVSRTSAVIPHLPTRLDLGAATYADVPRSEKASLEDARLESVKSWLETSQRPSELTDKDFQSFVRFSSDFFILHGALWRRSDQGTHQRVLGTGSRWHALVAAHDQAHHKGFYAT